MDLQKLKTALATLGAPAHIGYAPNGSKAPYVVLRPFLIDPSTTALAGNAIAWDNQAAAYSVGASVEASYNLARSLMSILQGARVDGVVLSTSMGYSGALVEGRYESQVTIQSNQGGI